MLVYFSEMSCYCVLSERIYTYKNERSTPP
nr:MAG TPA: calmodulin [Caudoviricetes sp.]